jgi:uncharacterized protein (TIGR02246 family)
MFNLRHLEDRLAPDKAFIQKLEDAFGDAFARKDLDTLVNMYTEDAELMPPGATNIRGRKGIAEYWQEGMKEASEGRSTTEQVHAFGHDAALETGSFSERLISPPGVENGKYMILWRKIGAEWKISLDIWNGNTA